MSWFHKLLPSSIRLRHEKKDVPQGLWSRCPNCEKMLFTAELERVHKVCSSCNFYFPLNAQERQKQIFDEVYSDLFENILPVDSLKFKDTKRYKDRLSEAAKKTTSSEAVVCSHGRIGSIDAILSCFDFTFIGGSMGSVAGERFTLAAEKAIELNIPLVCVASSGGARMQESLHSLMQMTKTSQAVAQLDLMKIPYIVILASPCMGGVSASFASLGDVLIGEPGALIGFAGQRVIKQTVREDLPDGFQKSELLLEKGAIDMIVERSKLKETLEQVLKSLLFHR